MAPAYFSTLLPMPLPIPPLYNMATPVAGLSPVASMFSQASIFFPLLGNPFFLVHWANSSLSRKFQLKCFLLHYTVNCFLFCASIALPSDTHSFNQALLSIYEMPNTILGTGDTTIKSGKSQTLPLWSLHSEETANK